MITAQEAMSRTIRNIYSETSKEAIESFALECIEKNIEKGLFDTRFYVIEDEITSNLEAVEDKKNKLILFGIPNAYENCKFSFSQFKKNGFKCVVNKSDGVNGRNADVYITWRCKNVTRR